MLKHPRLRACAAIAACLAAWLGTAGPAAALTLRFGVVPQQSASRLAELWAPLLHDLAERSGLVLELATAKDIPTFEACLAKGAYDIAYMNPYHYVVFHDRRGYQAFARQAGRMLQGIIVTRRGGPMRRVEELDGAKIAFPSPAAFGASVLTQAELHRRGIAFAPHYVKSHDSVYRGVALGLFPAGGGILRTLHALEPAVQAELEVLYLTGEYPPHAFAALPKVPAWALAALRDAMLASEDAAPELVSSLGFDGIQAAANADWDPIRALNLQVGETEIVLEDEGSCRSG